VAKAYGPGGQKRTDPRRGPLPIPPQSATTTDDSVDESRWHGACFPPYMVMSVRETRYVIVQRGQHALFAALQKRYASDPSRQVIWDRRSGEDRRAARLSVGFERRQAQRRMPADASVLIGRGFFVARAMRARQRGATR
jgi:hypothetical protein